MQDISHRKKFKPLYYCVMHCNEVGEMGKKQTSALRHRYAFPSVQFGNGKGNGFFFL